MYSLGGREGGHEKEYSVYACENDENVVSSLTWKVLNNPLTVTKLMRVTYPNFHVELFSCIYDVVARGKLF